MIHWGLRKCTLCFRTTHDDVIKWKHFSRYWRFVRGTHQSTVDSPHKGQWRIALMPSLICASTNGCANNRNAGNLTRRRAYYDLSVMVSKQINRQQYRHTIVFLNHIPSTFLCSVSYFAESVHWMYYCYICVLLLFENPITSFTTMNFHTNTVVYLYILNPPVFLRHFKSIHCAFQMPWLIHQFN